MARLLHHFDAHDRVLVEERAGVGAVGADPADARRQMDDDVGTLVRIHTGHVGLPGQVVLRAGEREDLGRMRLEEIDHMPSEKAPASRHSDALALPERRRWLDVWHFGS